jgi:uncharacterized protein YoxC
MKNGERRQLMSPDRPPEYIERDIEETRARMDATLDSLEAQFTQGQVVDKAMAIVRGRLHLGDGKDMAQSAGRVVLKNPVGFGLIGAGIAYMAYSAKKKREKQARDEERRRTVRVEHYHMGPQRPSYPYEEADYGGEQRHRGSGITERASQKGQQIKERAREKGHEASAKADELKDEARGRAGALRDQASERFEELGEEARARSEELKHQARDKAEEMKHQAEGVAHELSSRAEDMADEAKSRLSEWGSKAKHAGHEVTEELQGRAQGLREDVQEKASVIAQSARAKADNLSRSVRTASAKVQANSKVAARKAQQQAVHARDVVVEQFKAHPFLFIGLGLGLGAAVAASLPHTRRENELIGRHRDRLIHKVDEASAHGIERAREAAARAAEALEQNVLTGNGVDDAELGDEEAAAESPPPMDDDSRFE